jgi:squalene-hopene/tetraprenyl-beta-curcumene cyclase
VVISGANQGPELSHAFMLRWDLYRQYFPIVALGRSLRKHRAQN